MEGDRECYAWVGVIMKLDHGGIDWFLLCGVEIFRMKVSEGLVLPRGCSF